MIIYQNYLNNNILIRYVCSKRIDLMKPFLAYDIIVYVLLNNIKIVHVCARKFQKLSISHPKHCYEFNILKLFILNFC